MGNATEFENIIVCLATFHMTKFCCLVKYLRNNGAESIWIKTVSLDQMESSLYLKEHIM